MYIPLISIAARRGKVRNNPNEKPQESCQRKQHISLLSHCHNAQFRQLRRTALQHGGPTAGSISVNQEKMFGKVASCQIGGGQARGEGAAIRIGPIT